MRPLKGPHRRKIGADSDKTINKPGGPLLSFAMVAMVVLLIGCTGTATEIRQQGPLLMHSGTTYRGVRVAVLPFGGPNGPVARDVVV